MTIKGNQSEIAVAEVVGFIIILGIMMTGIALVTLYGYPALVKEQANANIKNMQRNMIVLQNDMESLTYKSVPYEETTLQVSDGTLSVINPNPISDPGHSRFTIEQNGTPIDFDPTIPGSIYFYPGLIQFVSSPPNAIIGLQNGAVVMNYFGQVGSTMLSEPRWFLDFDQSGQETLVLSFIQIHSPNPLSSGGTGTVQMKVSELYPTKDISNPDSTIDITYHDFDGYNTAWHNFFTNTRVFPSPPCSVSVSTLTITGVDRLVIKTYNITVLNL